MDVSAYQKDGDAQGRRQGRSASQSQRVCVRSYTAFCWTASALIQQLPKILPQQSQSLARKICWIHVWQIGRAPCRRTLLRMTRTQPRPYGVITPSSRQPLLEAMLRAFVWLVSNVVLACRTIFNRTTRDWHTDAAQEAQLPLPNDLTQEILQAETTGLSTGSGFKPASPAQAGVQTPHDVRTRNPSALRALTGLPPSRGTRLATRALQSNALALSPLIPTNVGIQGRRRTLSRIAASSLHLQQNRSWIPTFVGMSGSCCAKSA